MWENFLQVQPLEIAQKAVALRDHFARQGIGEHSTIGVASKAPLETIVTLFSLWSLNATTWLCPLREPASKLVQLSRHIRADLIVGTRELLCGNNAQAEQLLADVKHSCGKTLINTSGSTGQPKFVQHDVSQHFLSAEGVNLAMNFDASSNWLLSLPVYHVGGLAIAIRAALSGGSITMLSADERVEDVIMNENVTHISLVAAQLRKWIERPELVAKMQRATRIVLGGGPVPLWFSQVCQRHALPVVASYGATEMASTWTATLPVMPAQAGIQSINNSGKLLPSRELKLSEEGEILVRGPMLFRGYAASDLGPFDSDGFYRTSDIGRLDDDENLVVLGRKDNMFISGGENIHPQEIELSLLAHPRVEAARVIAVPSEKWGKRPVAYVRMKDQEQIRENDLKEHLKKSLPSFKIPDQFLGWTNDIRDKADALASNRRAP